VTVCDWTGNRRSGFAMAASHRLGHCGTNELDELRHGAVLQRTLFRSFVPITFIMNFIMTFLKRELGISEFT